MFNVANEHYYAGQWTLGEWTNFLTEWMNKRRCAQVLGGERCH